MQIPLCITLAAYKTKLLDRLLFGFIEGGRGNSCTGLSIHVPARVMGQYSVCYPGYGSYFVKFALVMDKNPESRIKFYNTFCKVVIVR